jgi:putative tricarboxylic transport membrane protein
VEPIVAGIQTLCTPIGLLALLIGASVGFMVGVLPGLGQGSALIFILPFSYMLPINIALILLAAALGSAAVGGSVTSIMLNTPGSAANLTTLFDGYPMARAGESGRALGLSGMSSIIGGVIGIIVLVAMIPAVRPLIYIFGASEYFWTIVIALLIVALSTAGGAFLKGLISGLMGIASSFIGFNQVSGGIRFTGGMFYFWDGINIIIFVVGLFALSELVILQAKGTTIATSGIKRARLNQSISGARETIRFRATLLRGSIIGTVIGIIPGTGSAIATYVSYGINRMMSKHKSTFGQGNPEGIIASEVANNAKDGGALLPTLFFGIPGSPEMAILLAGFIIFGIQPGPTMAFENLDLVWYIILAVMASNIMACILVILGAPILSRVTRIQISLVVVVAVPLSLGAVFASRSNPWDFILLILFSIIGIGMKRGGYPLSPLVLGYVLGPLAELTFFRTMMSGYFSPLALFRSTLSICLAIIAGLLVLTPVVLSLWQFIRNQNKASTSEELDAGIDSDKTTHKTAKGGSILMGVFLLIAALVMVIRATSYEFQGSIFPLIIGGLAILFLAVVLGEDFSKRAAHMVQAVLGPLSGRGEQRLEVGLKDLMPVLGWLFGFLAATFFVGTVVSNLIFIFLLLWKNARMSWCKAVMFSLVVDGFIYLLFGLAFKPSQWPGIIPSLIPEIIGGGSLPPLF